VRDVSDDARFETVPFWVVFLLVGAAVITAAESALLALGTGFFGAGFNTVALASVGQVSAFLLCSIVLDVGLLLLCWGTMTPLLRRAGLEGARAWWVMLAVGIGVPVLLAGYRYNVYSIAGAMFSVGLLHQTPLASSSSMVAELATDGMAIWVLPALGGALVLPSVGRWLGRLERRHPAWQPYLRLPSAGRSAAVGALILLLAAPTIRMAAGDLSWLRFGLERKGADIAALALLETVTDVDGDGFGPLSALPDPAPFDARLNPYAREIPGNGVDENGLAGDLATARPADGPVQAPLPGPGPRPHVLVLYLESFRQDMLGRVVNGRAVTPFLDRLAVEGAAADFAFTHTAWTLDSRASLFTGEIDPAPDQPTLIDDFHALGYEVWHFSGQDESYGDSERMLGVARADHFYDARQDLARRSSRSTAAVSLQVSWKVLAERIGEQLDAYDGKRPLFVYANVTDTHFPYVHDELDDILGVPPFDRSMIRSSRREDVLRAYANDAANVDRGCQRIVERFREAIGGADHGILVLADHGEAFYENGLLGHGQSLDDVETRIPLIVWGFGGEWPEPIAPSDVRGLLRRNLTVEREHPTPRFVASPERRLLQYAPSLDEPRLIGLRGLSGRLVYDLERDESRVERAPGDALPAVSAAPDSLRDEVIRRWEAVRSRPDPAR